jgi:hypothetical protein
LTERGTSEDGNDGLKRAANSESLSHTGQKLPPEMKILEGNTQHPARRSKVRSIKSEGEKKTMETQATTRRELETALIEKCWKDPEFKKAVVSDPKGALERHTGQKVPAQVKIFIHEEDANTLHLTIPVAPSSISELSDTDLDKVAGGTGPPVTLTTMITFHPLG